MPGQHAADDTGAYDYYIKYHKKLPPNIQKEKRPAKDAYSIAPVSPFLLISTEYYVL